MNRGCVVVCDFFSGSRRTCLFLHAALTVFLCCGNTVVAGDSAAVRDTYGRGVHAFFAGRLQQSEQLFSQVVAAGSQDPRVYYFRAMARLRLGQRVEAEQDMRLGASLEAENPGSQYVVGRSLERVQGTGRRVLENFRRQARLERAQSIRLQSRQRYERLEQRGPAVLHQDQPVPLESLLEQPGSPAAKAQPAPVLSPPANRELPPARTTRPARIAEPANSPDDLSGTPQAADEDSVGEPEVPPESTAETEPAAPPSEDAETSAAEDEISEDFDDEDPFADF